MNKKAEYFTGAYFSECSILQNLYQNILEFEELLLHFQQLKINLFRLRFFLYPLNKTLQLQAFCWYKFS